MLSHFVLSIQKHLSIFPIGILVWEVFGACWLLPWHWQIDMSYLDQSIQISPARNASSSLMRFPSGNPSSNCWDPWHHGCRGGKQRCPKMQPPSATPPAASVAVVSLLPRKASPTHHLTPAPALVQASFSQQQAFDFVFQSLPTLLFLTVTNFLLPLTQSMHPLLPTNKDGWKCILFPVPVELPTSAMLFIDLYQHCITPNHYALISKPVFHKSAQDAYRQLGRMSMRLQVQELESCTP